MKRRVASEEIQLRDDWIRRLIRVQQLHLEVDFD